MFNLDSLFSLIENFYIKSIIMFSILKIYFEKYFFIKLINIMTENKEDMVRITYYII